MKAPMLQSQREMKEQAVGQKIAGWLIVLMIIYLIIAQ